MYKKLLLILAGIMFIFGLTVVTFAQEAPPDLRIEESQNIGNKICPVSGEKIDASTNATYEYQGKIYNFCCPGCIDEFKKDPEKFIKKIEEEKSDHQDQTEDSGQHMHNKE